MLKPAISDDAYAQLEKALDSNDAAKREELARRLELPNEYANDADRALQLAMELLARGTIVKGSLGAPQPVAKQFASFNQLLTEAQQMKQLGASSPAPQLTDGSLKQEDKRR
jgi:hypothetical protein